MLMCTVERIPDDGEVDDTDMTAVEFLRKSSQAQPVRIVTSRDEYEEAERG